MDIQSGHFGLLCNFIAPSVAEDVREELEPQDWRNHVDIPNQDSYMFSSCIAQATPGWGHTTLGDALRRNAATYCLSRIYGGC